MDSKWFSTNLKRSKEWQRRKWIISDFEWWMGLYALASRRTVVGTIEMVIRSIKSTNRVNCDRNVTITELEHEEERRRRRKKTHLQIFSQQHSKVNGHYAFLLLHSASPLRSFFLMRACVHDLFQQHKLIPICSVLCAIYSQATNQSTAVTTESYCWFGAIAYFIIRCTFKFHSMVEP